MLRERDVQDLQRIWGRSLPGQKLSMPLWLTLSEPRKQVAPGSGPLLWVMLSVFSKPWAWCHHCKRGSNVCFDSSLDYTVSVGSLKISDLALPLKQLKIKPLYLEGFTNYYLLAWCPEMGGLEARSSIMAKAMVLCLSASCPPGSAPRGRWRAGRAEERQNQHWGVSNTSLRSHRCTASAWHAASGWGTEF